MTDYLETIETNVEAASYIEPTQEAFDSAEQITLDIVATASPNAITKTGSVIRELVVRPLAYMFSWATANLTHARTTSSIAYLKTSQETVNPIADAMASNFFVTRRRGARAKGIVTVTLSVPSIRLGQGTVFIVSDIPFVLETQLIITNAMIDAQQDNVTYVRPIVLGDNYVANIPVVAEDTGRIEIQPGAPVTIGFANNYIIEAELTSAITGGSDIETDSEMMARAEYTVADSGVGTYNGLRKKLDKAPITVTGMSVVAGEDLPLFRARYNNANINPGGFVDAYVKTQRQASVLALDFIAERYSEDSFVCRVGNEACAGFFSVLTVIAGGESIDSFELEFSSVNNNNTPEGARLSSDQIAFVYFKSDSPANTLVTRVYVSYLPGILQLQKFIDKDEERYIGQDVKIKAAVPVMVSVDCAVAYTGKIRDQNKDLLKSTISNYINTMNVGARYINFSDIRKVCAVALPGADVRLPCTISATVMLKDGSTDTSYSNTGIFDLGIQANKAYWESALCYFATTTDKIRISQA